MTGPAANPGSSGLVIWRWYRFGDLDRDQLYALLRARQDVFVVEQACPYPDIDGKDSLAWHLIGAPGNSADAPILASARLFAPGDYYPEAAIGRVLTTALGRGRGLGRSVMEECHRFVLARFGSPAVRLNGQGYLREFYESLGYRALKGPYDEDGIPHYEMLKER